MPQQAARDWLNASARVLSWTALGLLLTASACSGGEQPGYGATTSGTDTFTPCGDGACGPGQSCVDSVCVCQSGFSDCHGTCVDLTNNGSHCGACDSACTGQVCSNGACQDSCGAGLSGCASSCVNLLTSPEHCGACGVRCGALQVCARGQCQESGQVDTTLTAGSVGGMTSSNTASTSTGTADTTTTGASTTASGAGGTSSTGGTTATGTGISVDGTCYSVCASAASDPDGDGWGWEDEASCVVVGSQPYQSGTACDAGSGGAGNTSTTSTSTATSTTGSSDGCSAQPINPNATAQARNLLCYLYSIQGSQVLSGQQETSWDNPQADISFYTNNFGDAPAILGGDYLYPDGTTQRAIAYWNAGGIPMIRYHMGAPPRSDTYENSQSSSNINNVLTPGTSEYNSFMSKLDYAAGELQRLEDAGVAVLWAPFHETQPNGWFWWSKGTGSQLIQMWTMMYEYFTNTKGLDNLVWLFPFSGSPNAQYYPGAGLSDIAGPDTYETNQPFTSLFNATERIVGSGRPVPLHETGTIVNPDDMFNNGAAPWVLFSVWAGYQTSENSLAAIRNVYQHPATITRSEVPDLN